MAALAGMRRHAEYGLAEMARLALSRGPEMKRKKRVSPTDVAIFLGFLRLS